VTLPGLLLLARHGETDWNRDRRIQGHADIPLNVEGRRQAARLAERLATWEIDAIHASDLSRAAETARIVGDALRLAPLLSADWRELGLGALEGERRDAEVIAAAARSAAPLADGAETFAELHARVARAFERLARDHAGRTVLVVSHGGTLKALIAHLIGLPATHIDRLSLRANSSLSVVDFRHGRPQLALLNDARHLE
jgi:alpha-ribazole phosphatase/probable phosphoglycerate mutase